MITELQNIISNSDNVVFLAAQVFLLKVAFLTLEA